MAGMVFLNACQLLIRDCYFYYRNGFDFSQNPEFSAGYWGTVDTDIERAKPMGFVGRLCFAYPFLLIMSGPIGYSCLVHLLQILG